MGWLRRRRADAQAAALAGRLVRGRCWDDAALDAGVDAVREGHLKAGVALLRECRGDHDRRIQRARALGQAAVGRSDEIRGLVRAGMGAAEASDVLLWLGSTVIREAWRVRADGPPGVEDERFALFLSRLRGANDPLSAAAELAPADAAPWAQLLEYARGMRLERDQHDLAWHRVLERAPASYPAHASRLRSMTPRWGGSDESMFAFARQTVDSALLGSPIVAMLPLAHAEHLRAGGTPVPFTGRAKRELLAAERKCHPAIPGPYSREAHNLFGWALLHANEPQRARWHLTRVANRPARLPWDHDGPNAFAKALIHLDITPTPD